MNVSVFGLNPVGSSGGEQLLICPFHSDHTPSAWWNPVRNVFYCAVCGMGLNAHQFAERLGLKIDDIEDDYEDEAIEDYDVMGLEIAYYREVYRDDADPYLRSRNIMPQTANRYEILIWGRKNKAIHMPITDIRGEKTGYVQRFIDSPIRYKKVGTMQPLWPMRLFKGVRQDDRIYIFEGPFSAMRFHSYGLKFGMDWFAFALMGAKANREIAETVRNLNCVFLYDHDAAGINACYRMRQLLPSMPCYTLTISVDDMEDKQIENMTKKLMRKEGWE